MNSNQHLKPALTLTLVALLIITVNVSLVGAQGNGYELSWSNIGAGGGALTGSGYSLVNSIGQTEPGPTQTGGDYSLNGGVVDAGGADALTPGERRIYLPLINR